MAGQDLNTLQHGAYLDVESVQGRTSGGTLRAGVREGISRRCHFSGHTSVARRLVDNRLSIGEGAVLALDIV